MVQPKPPATLVIESDQSKKTLAQAERIKINFMMLKNMLGFKAEIPHQV